MEDLINRQAAIKAICEDSAWLESQGCTDIWMAERKQRDVDILSGLPSIDAVPVVRCRDCKIRYTVRCGMFDVEAEWEWTEDDGFCQYGERKES